MGFFRLLVRLLGGPPRRLSYPTSAGQRQPTTIRVQVETNVVVLERKLPQAGTVLQGRCWVIDGDTIVVDDVRLRLAGIDAPELDHPWGKRAKWALVELCKGQIVTARIRPELSYDRVVAECYLADGRDLAAELVRNGLALDWAKFSGGKYRHLEPADARRRLWRADARQRGKLRPNDTQIPD